MNMEPSLSLPLVKQNVNPRVWADGNSVGRAQNAIPVAVKLKDPHLFPHKKQYPLKPEVEEGLKPIIEHLKEQGLLIPCNSPSAAAAAAAAKSLQSCPTLYDPRDGSPPGSHGPKILQARTLEWVAISFSNA